MQTRFWPAFKCNAREVLQHYFAPLTWSLAWLTGRLQRRPETVPIYRDWLHGIRYVTPAGRNVFLDLGFPPDEAEELLRRTHLNILEKMDTGSADCADVKAVAIETFGDYGLAIDWLQQENPALGTSPVEYLRQGNDKREVLKVLRSITHGGVV